MIPKWSPKYLVVVVASQGRFEYLEHRGEGSVPSRQGSLPGSRTAAEPSWSMLAAGQHMHLDSRPKLPMSCCQSGSAYLHTRLLCGFD